MSDEVTARVLAEATIPGLDIPDALARMGNSPKLYMRIIDSFITNMPGNLGELATSTITAETLKDYSIRIHGAKGSCYGIGANAAGDKAKALEMASKADDLDTCLRDNDDFIACVQELIKDLEDMKAKIASGSDALVSVAQPDPVKLAALLSATKNFDIDQMSQLVEELSSVQYAKDGDIMAKIKQSFDAFDYQTIEETIAAYL